MFAKYPQESRQNFRMIALVVSIIDAFKETYQGALELKWIQDKSIVYINTQFSNITYIYTVSTKKVTP